MVIKVDERSRDSFLPLIPEPLHGYVRSGEAFCIGCVRDDTAVGVLVFMVVNGADENGDICALIELLWICTAEAYRASHVASEMLEALADIYDSSSTDGIICALPQDSRYGFTEAWLESWGFDFDDTDIPVMVVGKEDCRIHAKDINKDKVLSIVTDMTKPDGLISIKEIPKMKFRKVLNEMLVGENPIQYRIIPTDRDAYDPGISYAFIHDNKVSSMILFERRSSSELRMVLLKAFPQAEPKELLSLLHYSAGSYYLNEPEEAVIWFTLAAKRSLDLARHIFPEKDIMHIHWGAYR